jgi:ABC-type molybdate transport system permease subunit
MPTAALAIYDMIQGHQEGAAAGMVAILTSITIVALYIVNKLTAVKREPG